MRQKCVVIWQVNKLRLIFVDFGGPNVKLVFSLTLIDLKQVSQFCYDS